MLLSSLIFAAANIRSKFYNQKEEIGYMPLVYQQEINSSTKIGLWHIVEPEAFFLKKVMLQREIIHSHKRLQHLAGRYLLKELYPEFPYQLLRIADTRKPFLENEAFHFSISHCGGYAAAIVSSTDRVGVDVEMVSIKVARVKHKFLSQAEQQILLAVQQSVADNISMQLLTAAWSIKEALFKWYGLGQIDFKDHLHILSIELTGDSGRAHCRFLKKTSIDIEVYFLFINDNCLSWVAHNM